MAIERNYGGVVEESPETPLKRNLVVMDGGAVTRGILQRLDRDGELFKEFHARREDIFRRIMIIFGASLVLILFSSETWFHNYLQGREKISITGKSIVPSDYTDQTLYARDLTLYEKLFCRGYKRASNCSKN